MVLVLQLVLEEMLVVVVAVVLLLREREQLTQVVVLEVEVIHPQRVLLHQVLALLYFV